MDERLGREIASFLDIRVLGVIGILVEAKDKGLIDEVKPFLDLLMSLAGFYIGPQLYARIGKDQNET